MTRFLTREARGSGPPPAWALLAPGGRLLTGGWTTEGSRSWSAPTSWTGGKGLASRDRCGCPCRTLATRLNRLGHQAFAGAYRAEPVQRTCLLTHGDLPGAKALAERLRVEEVQGVALEEL